MPRYYAGTEEQWLADRRGPLLVLSDGSVWEVGDADLAKIANWVLFSAMEVAEMHIAGRIVYVLVNKSFGAQVRAQFVKMSDELDAA
ncbi:MAG: hypothetical protein JO187_01215 [Acidobacteria bacterium]|nr:hypothetical protein [Acidobacteriota bacterium]